MSGATIIGSAPGWCRAVPLPGLARTMGASVVSTAAGVYSPVTDRALAAGAAASAQLNAAMTAKTRNAPEIRRRIRVCGQFGS
ncbi:unannotated protein [freshwater metagenome]|uniref:Unannotated protein n=1 Tax=freshwater metagenome TaxID=449393 RepID=A0A6J7IX59_9ZZZZ